MEFHIARSVRERLGVGDLLFSYTGNVVFANLAAARKLAFELNNLRQQENGGVPDPKRQVNAGALYAMGLIDELSHAIAARYRKETDPAVLSEGLRWFASQTSPAELDRLLLAFTQRFPNTEILSGKLTAEQWLAGETEGLPNREAAFEELLLLHIANTNPAFKQFAELFDDTELKQT